MIIFKRAFYSFLWIRAFYSFLWILFFIVALPNWILWGDEFPSKRFLKAWDSIQDKITELTNG